MSPAASPAGRSLLACACLLALITPMSASAGQDRPKLTPTEIARRATASVVTISTPTGTGSGVLVDASGTLVTNLHVVRGDQQASVKLANGDIYDDVSVVDVDARKDLLVLRIKAFNLTAASLGNSDQLVTGDRVFVVGSPRGLQNTLSDGLISAVRDSGDGYRLLQTTAAVSPGSSGGGMFNEYGELVGVVVGKRTDADSVNFAVPINYARGLIATPGSTTLAALAQRYPREAAPAIATNQAPQGQGPQGQSPQRGRVLQFLKATGFAFEAAGEGWRMQFKGDHATVWVDVLVHADLALVQSGPISSKPLTQAQMARVLSQNYQKDLVKAGLVNDELVTSAETELRTLDSSLLKRLIQNVASFADETFGELSAASPATAGSAAATYGPLTGPDRTRRTESLDLNRGAATIRYETGAWQAFGDKADAQFRHQNGEAFFRIIAERTQMTFEGLEAQVVANARTADPQARIARKGWRTVNGERVMVLEIEATVTGIPIVYYGHYYTGTIGTIQIVGWTSRNLLDEHRVLFDGVASGLQIGR
jgi:S1-C subfamily serine protease